MLITEILIGGDEQVEPGGFRRGKQVTIGELRPAALPGGGDFMSGERAPQGHGCALIKKKSASSRGEAPLGMAEHSEHLLAGDAFIPRQEVIHRGTGFEVFEKRAHREARALEDPRAADASRHTFDGFAFRPIELFRDGIAVKAGPVRMGRIQPRQAQRGDGGVAWGGRGVVGSWHDAAPARHSRCDADD